MTDIGLAPASSLKAGELSTACRKASMDFQSEDAVENGSNSAWPLGSNINVIPASSSLAPSLAFLSVTCRSRLSLKAVAQPSDQPPYRKTSVSEEEAPPTASTGANRNQSIISLTISSALRSS